MFVAAVLTQMMVYKDYLSVGNYQEVYLGTWLSVPVIVIFLNTKLLFQEERLSERTKRFSSVSEAAYLAVIFLVDLLEPEEGWMSLLAR